MLIRRYKRSVQGIEFASGEIDWYLLFYPEDWAAPVRCPKMNSSDAARWEKIQRARRSHREFDLSASVLSFGGSPPDNRHGPSTKRGEKTPQATITHTRHILYPRTSSRTVWSSPSLSLSVQLTRSLPVAVLEILQTQRHGYCHCWFIPPQDLKRLVQMIFFSSGTAVRHHITVEAGGPNQDLKKPDLCSVIPPLLL